MIRLLITWNDGMSFPVYATEEALTLVGVARLPHAEDIRSIEILSYTPGESSCN